MLRVLLVEDDSKIAEHLLNLLEAEGFSLFWIDRLEKLSQALRDSETYELIILDRLLGSADTKSYLRRIRSTWPRAGILILSAINTPIERAELLESGADDYVGKPFLSEELIARLRGLARRVGRGEEEYRQLGDTIIHLQKRHISVGEKSESLPAKEFLVLRLLLRDPGRVYRKEEILDRVWGTSSSVETNVVEATILNLRKRLAAVGSTLKLKNLRNSGYWIET